MSIYSMKKGTLIDMWMMLGVLIALMAFALLFIVQKQLSSGIGPTIVGGMVAWLRK